MPVNLSNSKDIVATSVSVLTDTKVIDLLLAIEGITGLPPSTLDSLEKIATAVNNDPQFWQHVGDSITSAVADKATTSYVNQAISDLVGGAPGALNTLNELASALGNDASFATTVLNQLATKQKNLTPDAPISLTTDSSGNPHVGFDATTLNTLNNKQNA